MVLIERPLTYLAAAGALARLILSNSGVWDLTQMQIAWRAAADSVSTTEIFNPELSSGWRRL
jgi:hypothetical protein